MLKHLLCIPLVAVAGIAVAAEPAPPIIEQHAAPATAIDAQLQAYLAGTLILENQQEVALCQFALTRTEDPKVKSLINKMIVDHAKFLGELKKYAPQAAALEIRQRVESGTDAGSAATPRRSSVITVSQKTERSKPQAVPATAGPVVPQAKTFSERLLGVEFETAQESVALNQKLLSKFKGASFDQAFLGQQIGMHVTMLAKLRGSAKYSTGEFQTLLKKAEETTRMHKRHAEQLMEELAKGTIEKASGTPRS